MRRICVVGDWHQAVVVAACLADAGHQVRVLAGTAERAALLRGGRAPVHEPGLDALLRRGLAAGRLTAFAEPHEALQAAEFVLLSLDTPIDENDAPRLDEVFAAARRVGSGLDRDVTVVVTAQVPVGTCHLLRHMISEVSGRCIRLAHVPEFLRLGQAIDTFVQADRFIIGCDDDEAATSVAELYAPFGRPLIRMSVASAEMAKHASNAFLAVSISLANEIADLCSAVDADIEDVTRAMRLDPRIGQHAFLGAGLGFAGGTLGRDLSALHAVGEASGLATAITDAAAAVNRARGTIVLRHLESRYGRIAGLRIGVLGLTYKPGTSTLRRSIALAIIDELVDNGAVVAAFDPHADLNELSGQPRFVPVRTPAEAADGADALVVATPWSGLTAEAVVPLASRMRHPFLIDARNHFDRATLERGGIDWVGVGRGAAAPSSGNGARSRSSGGAYTEGVTA